MTTEEARLKRINTAAAKHLEDILRQYENEEISTDDFISVVYGHLVASNILGFDTAAMEKYAASGASRIQDLLCEEQDAPADGKEDK